MLVFNVWHKLFILDILSFVLATKEMKIIFRCVFIRFFLYCIIIYKYSRINLSFLDSKYYWQWNSIAFPMKAFCFISCIGTSMAEWLPIYRCNQGYEYDKWSNLALVYSSLDKVFRVLFAKHQTSDSIFLSPQIEILFYVLM